MTRSTISIDDSLLDYLRRVSVREPSILRRLREETARLPNAQMQLSPEAGRFLALLVELLNARRTIEVGVFTGYSSLCVALALPPDGRLVACDVSEEYTAVARRYWAEAGVAEKIDLRLAPALATLDGLIAEGASGSFDFAFIDADKPSYLEYYERALRLLRPGGLIAADNVLWGGRIADPTVESPSALALRAFNERLATDERVTISLVPIGDGLTLALKRR